MRCLREHIYRLDGGKAIRAAGSKQRNITRQRARVTRNIDQRARPHSSHCRERAWMAPGARWINEHRVKALVLVLQLPKHTLKHTPGALPMDVHEGGNRAGSRRKDSGSQKPPEQASSRPLRLGTSGPSGTQRAAPFAQHAGYEAGSRAGTVGPSAFAGEHVPAGVVTPPPSVARPPSRGVPS